MIWLLLASLACADEPAKGASLIKQEITIKGKSAGPKVSLPGPAAGPAFAREVVESLDLGKAAPGGGQRVELPRLKERLSRLFPAPPFLAFKAKEGGPAYDRWVFEVWDSKEVIWQQSGEGALAERLEWDGSAFSGIVVARVGATYSFRFRGYKGREVYLLDSETIALESMAYSLVMGDRRLEVANKLLFKEGDASPTIDGVLVLKELADRLRRVTLAGSQVHRLVLYQKEPKSKLASARAKSLRTFLAKALFIVPEKVSIEVKPILDRGDCLAALMPPENR